MSELMKLPRQVRGVNLRAESFNPDANTIDVVFTTGAAVTRYSWDDGPYIETLDVTTKAVRLDRLNNGAPFLNTHSSYDLSDVIGCVVPGTARIDGSLGVATIKLSSAAADADTVGKIRDGVIRNVSVGYLVHAVVRTEATDKAIATCRVTDWEPYEISAVAIPADADAHIRTASKPDEAVLFPCTVSRSEPAPPATHPGAAALARMRMLSRSLLGR
ncbi:HK97 family phage prohead protease [Beijerinckia sp. L45]|uniref:HK97 family phage prohead protease n=1 Tax=Beijerinckia sp. L45 TaxID=1641855 RepID=UPI00131AD5CE|nr:HK97 family phage prohead protease [Beijerinckia sp. L45]